MIHLAVLGSTRGTDLQAIIDAIKSGALDATVDVVVSNKSDAYILERAKKYAIPTLCIASKGKPPDQFDRELMEVLEQYNPDLILLIGYMKILSPKVVRRWKGKIWNVHPSLLPKFAGGMDFNVHQAVLDAGETKTGCTIHEVYEGVDSGRIVLQKSCLVEPEDTVDTLKVKVQKLEGEAFVESLKGYEKNIV
ncbi:phosphoribosylglycinamide formyltransferase [Candidatus Uhrbacteria bacterium]|nr:phosphoribosylglycinamide formyltransferase [Candidatus Uhrbacteria bacterium]